MPDKADEIVATQQARITNPDRKRQYAFISPSVSPRKEVRDSVFASLLVAENRRVEPWASAALSNLNCQLRQQEAVGYIRPALEALQEIQRTGDIFFPRDWVRALLSGHTSSELRRKWTISLPPTRTIRSCSQIKSVSRRIICTDNRNYRVKIGLIIKNHPD